MRSGVNGVWRKRAPVSWAIALPIAGVTNGVAICPTPVPRVVGRYHFDVHWRHVAHARDQIVVKVRLLDCAILDRDPLHQGEAQPVDNAALGLRRHIVGLHRDAAVEGRQLRGQVRGWLNKRIEIELSRQRSRAQNLDGTRAGH